MAFKALLRKERIAPYHLQGLKLLRMLGNREFPYLTELVIKEKSEFMAQNIRNIIKSTGETVTISSG